jgi:predicted TIM-barrel fold metal-dependent hydrolase
MAMEYQFVSGDDHMDAQYLPKELWQARVPARFREDAPRVVDTPEGPKWVFKGTPIAAWGPSRSLGLVDALERSGALAGGQLRPSDPKLRLEDMDRDGQDAEVIYTLLTFKSDDPELNLACYRAYNDWAAEFNAQSPERLFLLALLPTADPAETEREVRRVAASGIRGAQFNVWDAARPVFDEVWEPVWAAAAETKLPLSFHIGGGVRSAGTSPHRGELATWVAVNPLQLDEPMAGMIFCGALERHPDLRIVVAESGLAWVGYLLERMTRSWSKVLKNVSGVKLQLLPKEIFRRQMWISFEEENIGLKVLSDIGEDNVMWASDYPHPDSTWPESRAYIEENMRPLIGAAATRKLTCDNAVRLYRLSPRSG